MSLTTSDILPLTVLGAGVYLKNNIVSSVGAGWFAYSKLQNLFESSEISGGMFSGFTNIVGSGFSFITNSVGDLLR